MTEERSMVLGVTTAENFALTVTARIGRLPKLSAEFSEHDMEHDD